MRLSLFPFMPEVQTLARNRSLLTEHEIVSVISFKQDAARMQAFARETGIPCTTSVEEGLQRADCLVLLRPPFSVPDWQKYGACIDCAARRGIAVHAGRGLIDDLPEEHCRAMIHPIQNAAPLARAGAVMELRSISTPVIAVAGLGENCGKFECQLELKRYLDGLGYRCTALCSNPLGVYAGMELLPDFLFDATVAFPEKVIGLNRYVDALCRDQDPDVLLIGVPGGVMPLSGRDTNFFLELPLVVSSALRIDEGVLTVYHIDGPLGFLDMLTKLCRERFSVPVGAFYMARQVATFDPDTESMQFLFLSDAYIAAHSAAIPADSRIALPLQEHSHVYKKVVENLQENLETV